MYINKIRHASGDPKRVVRILVCQDNFVSRFTKKENGLTIFRSKFYIFVIYKRNSVFSDIKMRTTNLRQNSGFHISQGNGWFIQSSQISNILFCC